MTRLNYTTVERTFYYLDGTEIKWKRTKEEEELDKLDWFDTWLIYAKSIGVDFDRLSHNHTVEYRQEWIK